MDTKGLPKKERKSLKRKARKDSTPKVKLEVKRDTRKTERSKKTKVFKPKSKKR